MISRMEQNKVFKRKTYCQIPAWKNSLILNSALLIEGARRVRKSSVATAFAENVFPIITFLSTSESKVRNSRIH